MRTCSSPEEEEQPVPPAPASDLGARTKVPFCMCPSWCARTHEIAFLLFLLDLLLRVRVNVRVLREESPNSPAICACTPPSSCSSRPMANLLRYHRASSVLSQDISHIMVLQGVLREMRDMGRSLKQASAGVPSPKHSGYSAQSCAICCGTIHHHASSETFIWRTRDLDD